MVLLKYYFSCLYNIQIAIEIDDIYEDNNFSSILNVEQLNSILEDNHINARLKFLLKRAITVEGKPVENIDKYKIVVIGGSVRIPFIQKAIEEFSELVGIEKKIEKTLNYDESNSYGADYYNLIINGIWKYKCKQLDLIIRRSEKSKKLTEKNINEKNNYKAQSYFSLMFYCDLLADEKFNEMLNKIEDGDNFEDFKEFVNGLKELVSNQYKNYMFFENEKSKKFILKMEGLLLDFFNRFYLPKNNYNQMSYLYKL